VGTLPSPPAESTAALFISQIPISPAVSRHKMSAKLSPLKSPVPTTDQLVGTLPTPAVEALARVQLGGREGAGAAR
jgi:hypothetical protein